MASESPVFQTGEQPEKSDSNHLKSFKEFFDHINQAAKTSLPRESRRYAKVHVLLLRWQEDDLGTEKEINDLEEILKGLYNYETERFVIPSDDSTIQLEDALNDFRRARDGEANLLILYYGGHGALEHRSDHAGRSIWKAKKKGGPHLIWSELQGVLERAKADVVFILDCCFAATASRGPGSKEGLWACNSEVTTTGVNDNSFTRNLIEELKALHATRFNIAILHARLMRRYRQPGDHQLLSEPWYTFLGDDVAPSVEITPQPQRHQCNESLQAPASDSASTSGESSATSSLTSLTIDESSVETLVLLGVRLKSSDEIPHLVTWRNWCHVLAPDDVASVHALGRLSTRDLVRLEGYFVSHSNLLLVSMPIFLWDRLPQSPAYSFIGFVKSPNLYISESTSRLEKQLTSIADRKQLPGVPSPGKAYDFLEGRKLHSTSITERSLASDFWDEGRWNEAIDLEVQMIKRIELDSPDDNSEDFCRRIGEKALSEHHTLLKATEKLECRTLEAKLDNPDIQQPDILINIQDLASIYWAQGRWEEAQVLSLIALWISEKAFGKDHICSWNCLDNLLPLMWSQGAWSDAEECAAGILRSKTKRLAHTNPSALASEAKLAHIYHNSLQLTKAESSFAQLVERRKAALGMDHPDTFASMEHLACAHEALKQWESVSFSKNAEEGSLWLAENTLPRAGHGLRPFELAELRKDKVEQSLLWKRNSRDDIFLKGFISTLVNERFVNAAASLGNLLIIRLLLTLGAMFEVQQDFPEDAIISAAKHGHVDIAMLLLDQEGNADRRAYFLQLASLAAVEMQLEGAAVQLAKHIESHSGSQKLLLNATKWGFAELVTLLLDRGVDVNSRDSDGRTALSLAASSGHLQILAQLLDRKADVEAKDVQGRTALMYAAMRGRWAVAELLLQHGCEVDAKDEGRTPLHWGVLARSTKIVRLLIDYGADVQKKDHHGRSPLSLSRDLGEKEIEALLLSAKTRPRQIKNDTKRVDDGVGALASTVK